MEQTVQTNVKQSEYEAFLLAGIQQIESQQIVPTSDVNYRNINSIYNNFEDLKVMLQHIKANKLCNICQSPEKRSKFHIRTPVFPTEYALESSLITINREYCGLVESLCRQAGLSTRVLQNKHINMLMNYRLNGQLDKIKEFFAEYDIYICTQQRANTCLEVLGCRMLNVEHTAEKNAIKTLLDTLKQVQTQEVNPEQLLQEMKSLADQLNFHVKQNVENPFSEAQPVFLTKYEGFFFQRMLRFERQSNQFNKMIPAKCVWIFHYDIVRTSAIKSLAEAQKKTVAYYYHINDQLNQYITIDTCDLQVKSLLKSKLNTQLILQQNQTFMHYTRMLSSAIPALSQQEKQTLDMKSLLTMMPFKQYNILDSQVAQKAVTTFQQFMKGDIMMKKLDIYKNPENLVAIINRNLQEECIVCFQKADQAFVFGCCGTILSIPCMLTLLNSRCIKCPTCRVIISNQNQQLGAFFLNEHYVDQDLNATQKPELMTTSIIIQNGQFTQKPHYSGNEELVDIVIYFESYQQFQWRSQLFEAISHVPLNTKFKIHVFGVNQAILDKYHQILNIQ